jgi:hypothetical protein
MNRQETKLLVENWKALLSKSEQEFVIEEGFLDNVKSNISMLVLTSILGGIVNVPVAQAEEPTKIAHAIENAFEEKNPGVFNFEVNSKGDVVATHERTKRTQTILTSEQCDNVSSEELENALVKLRTLGYKSYKRALEKAAETAEEVRNDQSPEKRSLADKINSISDANKTEIIKDFSGDKDGFNLELMQYNIVAKRLFGKDPDFKKYNSEKDIVIYLIMRSYRSYRSYLPSR